MEIKEFSFLYYKLLTEAPKFLRTHCFTSTPTQLDIICPFSEQENSHKITWSEFETHIWCYDCQKDILITFKNSGIFSGPIPGNITEEILGISLNRINIKTLDIIKIPQASNSENFDSQLKIWNNTYVQKDELIDYICMVDNIILTK